MSSLRGRSGRADADAAGGSSDEGAPDLVSALPVDGDRLPRGLETAIARAGAGHAVAAVTVLALLARLYELGWRIAHQDEARVADWILHFVETGVWEYRPIIHGPFLPHVNRVVFLTLGASDFTMRLVVAVVGGLLPLSAWLLRDRLSDGAVVALALLLAGNPLLLYFSRFMRNDLLLAAFAFASFAFLVRAIDTRRARHLFAATGLLALGFTAKENALLYPACWIGAGALLLDHRLTLAVVRGDAPLSALPDWVARPLDWARRLLAAVTAADTARTRALLADAARPAAVGAGLFVEFLGIIVFFYAPRSPGYPGVGLWDAVADPTKFPTVIEAATLGAWAKFVETWGGSMQGDATYLSKFQELTGVLLAAGLAVTALSVVGFVVDRYAGDRPNDVVAAGFYWGAASVLGYPLAVDNPFPWEPVHMVIPLTIPAAAALAMIYREGRDALAQEDFTGAALTAIILLLVAWQVGSVAVSTSYANPQSPDNPMVQYAQPSGKMHPELAAIREIAHAKDAGTDVTFYGEIFDRPPDATWEPTGTPPEGWFARLPLPWYLHRYGAAVSSTTDADALVQNPPPVIIALRAGAYGNPTYVASDVGPRLDGYVAVERQQYRSGRTLVFFIDADRYPGRTGTPR
ncbi:MAG: flippase activity-associated protein Agl23 [Halobacteriaceae archaeon]